MSNETGDRPIRFNVLFLFEGSQAQRRSVLIQALAATHAYRSAANAVERYRLAYDAVADGEPVAWP